MNTLLTRSLGLTLALSAVLAVPSRADDQEFRKAWTSIGSAGSLNGWELDSAALNGPTLSFSVNGVGRMTAHYNVTAVDRLFSDIGERAGFRLDASYVDPGAGASLTVALIEDDLNSSASTVLLSFNTNSFPQSFAVQRQSVSTCIPHVFDFDQKAYRVDVTFDRASGARTPSLRAVEVAVIPCID
jgi:hypothetical protein